MAKLLITLSVAILLLSGLTFLFVVTQEPPPAPATPKTTKPDSSAKTEAALRAVQTELRSMGTKVTALKSSNTQLGAQIRKLETQISGLRELIEEPVEEEDISPTSGPSRIEVSRPPDTDDDDEDEGEEP